MSHWEVLVRTMMTSVRWVTSEDVILTVTIRVVFAVHCYRVVRDAVAR